MIHAVSAISLLCSCADLFVCKLPTVCSNNNAQSVVIWTSPAAREKAWSPAWVTWSASVACARNLWPVPPPFGVAPTYGMPPTTVPTPAPAVEPIYPGVVPAPTYGMPPPGVVPPPPAYGGFPAMPPPFTGMWRALLTDATASYQQVRYLDYPFRLFE